MKKGIEYADKSWNPYSGCLNIENELPNELMLED